MAEHQNMKLRIDESKMETTYANGFRHHANNQVQTDHFVNKCPYLWNINRNSDEF